MAHQGSKFENEGDRNEFLKWVDELEFEVNKIPREDLVLYLHVPWQVAIELSKQKSNRHYLNGKKDIQEADLNHRQKTEDYQREKACGRHGGRLHRVGEGRKRTATGAYRQKDSLPSA